MTFLEIQQAAYEALGYASSPPTDVATRVKSWINEGYRHLIRRTGLSDLRPMSYEFASVADQNDYAMPSAMERIDTLVNQTQNLKLLEMTLDSYRALDPGELTTGTPIRWIAMGRLPVTRQPASTGLWVASSSASDTTQTVTVQTVDASGRLTAAVTATLTGTTRAQLGSATDNLQVLKYYLSDTAVGSVTLFDASSSGNSLGTIPAGSTSVFFQVVRLWPTATAADTYVVNGQVRLSTLVGNTDAPIVPEIFHDLLVTYARMREYERTGKTAAWQIARADWDDGAKRMQAQVQFPPDYRPVPGLYKDHPIGWNGLTDGAYFPAD